jgi:hypothetical protein
LIKEFRSGGFTYEGGWKRKLVHKWTPRTIDTQGRGEGPAEHRLTMQWEYIVCLRRR